MSAELSSPQDPRDEAPSPESLTPGARRLMRLSVAGAALLMVAGAAAFTLASIRQPARAEAEALTVTLDGRSCEPADLTVPEGRSTFRIVNRTDRAVEWEILDGVMVVEERENIAPGLTQTLSARLVPGRYDITCGLLSNPRGRLTVTAAAGEGSRGAAPELRAFVGPLAEYSVYLGTEAGRLVKATAALEAAIGSGDVEAARAAYAEARRPFMHLRPAASRHADLDEAIDPLAAYLERREADPAFTGFHRIEYGLYAKDSLDGLAPVAAKLAADASLLKARLRETRLTPELMATGAVRRLAALADTGIPDGEDGYSGTDLADIEAEVAGIGKVATLLLPLGETAAPEAAAETRARMAALDADIASLRGPAGFPPYAEVPAESRAKLAAEARAFATSLAAMNAALGLGPGELG